MHVRDTVRPVGMTQQEQGGGMSRKRILEEAANRLIRKCFVRLTLCCLLCPALAWSQILTLTPSLRIGERYDDNIFQRSGFGMEEDERKIDDFITVITPSIEVRYLPRSDMELQFSYRPSFEFFADNSANNQVSHILNLTVASSLSRRFSINGGNQLTITEEPVDRDPDQDPVNEEQNSGQQRGRTIRNATNATVRFRLAPRTSLGALLQALIKDIEEADELDEFRYTLGGFVSYLTNIARTNRADLRYKVDFFTFEKNSPMAGSQAAFQVHTVSAGYEHHFSPTLTGNVRLGYSVTFSNAERLDGNASVVGDIGLRKTLRTGEASIGYARLFTSGGGSGNEVISDRLVLRFASNLTSKLVAGLQANVSYLDFEADDEGDNDDRWVITLRPRVSY